MMNQPAKFQEIATTYRKYGWQPARVLMRADTLAQLRDATGEEEARFEGIAVEESTLDAIWFTRPAQGGRDAWELRLVAETPFALFELFEPDEAEEDRIDVRREMEAQLKARMNVEE